MARTTLTLAVAVGLLALVGCGADEPDEPGGASTDPCGGGGEAYYSGVSKTASDGTRFTIVDAVPAPPARFENSWQVRVTDAAGTALTGEMLSAAPWMPKHGHGSPTVTATADAAGLYHLDDVRLSMPGVWQVTLSDASGASALFEFCIAD